MHLLVANWRLYNPYCLGCGKFNIAFNFYAFACYTMYEFNIQHDVLIPLHSEWTFIHSDCKTISDDTDKLHNATEVMMIDAFKIADSHPFTS